MGCPSASRRERCGVSGRGAKTHRILVDYPEHYLRTNCLAHFGLSTATQFLSPRTCPALAVSMPVDSQIEVENALIDFSRVCNTFVELRVVFVSFRVECDHRKALVDRMKETATKVRTLSVDQLNLAHKQSDLQKRKTETATDKNSTATDELNKFLLKSTT
jgi:hypothetical protein